MTARCDTQREEQPDRIWKNRRGSQVSHNIPARFLNYQSETLY